MPPSVPLPLILSSSHTFRALFSRVYPPTCSTELCPVPCGSHGVCSEGRCQCEEGWVGAACDQRACHPRCEEHGQCHDGTCICQPGWEGEHCNMGELSVDSCGGVLIIPCDILITVINGRKKICLSWLIFLHNFFSSLNSHCSPPAVTHDLDVVVKGNLSLFRISISDLCLLQHAHAQMCVFLFVCVCVCVCTFGFGTHLVRRLSRVVQRAWALYPGAERLALRLPGWMEWAWMQRCHGNWLQWWNRQRRRWHCSIIYHFLSLFLFSYLFHFCLSGRSSIPFSYFSSCSSCQKTLPRPSSPSFLCVVPLPESPASHYYTEYVLVCVCMRVCVYVQVSMSLFPLVTAKCLICIPPARIKGTQRNFQKFKHSKRHCFFGYEVCGDRWAAQCVSLSLGAVSSLLVCRDKKGTFLQEQALCSLQSSPHSFTYIYSSSPVHTTYIAILHYFQLCQFTSKLHQTPIMGMPVKPGP